LLFLLDAANAGARDQAQAASDGLVERIDKVPACGNGWTQKFYNLVNTLKLRLLHQLRLKEMEANNPYTGFFILLVN